MDKNAIKKYAIWAREELIKRVSTKAEEYAISSDVEVNENLDAIGDKVLTSLEKQQRKSLIRLVKEKGFEHAMEEVAYTWFNRFIALRFMEVNGYLSSKIRVFTDEENNFKPQILDEAIRMELDGLDIEKVIELKEQNKTDELYKYLIITQCNALHDVLPKMFPKIDDYTQLLFPENILREGSAIEQMIAIIPEEDWKDAVQILGWLYQYYNSVPKDTVFANLKKNIKISKENIPAATQLFTPDWIVRYMVENSLGRIYIDSCKDEGIYGDGREVSEMTQSEVEEKRILNEKYIASQMGWKYYLPEAEQKKEVSEKLVVERYELYSHFNIANIKIIDPCMGSGHILVYAFDVLLQIYESHGYTSRDAVASILENNLFGLDIDERAYQLAYFALMMKARSYDRRFFSRKIEPQVYCPKGYEDGEEYGSLLNVDELEEKPHEPEEMTLFDLDYDIKLNTWNFRRLLNQQYDVVVTNPPYMGSKGMSANLSKYVQSHYGDSKADMFAVFIERTLEMAKKNGYSAMITQHAWMFLSSYEKLRTKLLHADIINMAHLGARAFEEIGGEVVQTASWVMKNSNTKGYKGIYKRLVEFNSQDIKEAVFLSDGNLYTAAQENFMKISGSPIAYWVSENFIKMFSNGLFFEYSISDGQNVTSDNGRFVRNHWETLNETIGKGKKWRLYAKGGGYRKWYGNLIDIVDWSESAVSFYHKESSARVIPEYLWYKKGITWGLITSNSPSFRLLPDEATFDKGGSSIFLKEYENYNYFLGLLNSKVFLNVVKVLNSTLNFQVKDIRSMPIVLKNENIVINIVEENILISKTDWDSFETSWDFKKHPLIANKDFFTEHPQGEKTTTATRLEHTYTMWQAHTIRQFEQLKANEEELNRIFIDIYGLQDELTPEVEDKDVTVRLADKSRDIKSLISYAVGCMFGRYSLDVNGLAYAGGKFDEKYIKINGLHPGPIYPSDNVSPASDNYKYIYDGNNKIELMYNPDLDNIIPICNDEYFEDDIVGRFVEFVKVVYGSETLEENLDFIADALGGKGTSREVIRNYFLNGFFTDHCKIYQKRPIYWQFDSGKKKGFKALIYMHRYEPDTMARVRTDYVHEQQGRYRTAIEDLERRILGASTGEKVKLNKQLTILKEQDIELRDFEEKVHHLADQMISIDLDDGVRYNYAIFGDVLTKIK